MFPWEGKPKFPDAACYITGILQHQWTTSNVHAYSFRSQCCCYYWPWVLLTHLFLSLQGSRITHDWLVFLLLSERDPDGSTWWSLTCPEGSLLVPGTRQLYFVTPPFQPQIAIASAAQSTPEIRTLPSLSGLPGSQHLGQLHQQKTQKLREVYTYCPQSGKHKWGTCGDATITRIHSTAKDCSPFATGRTKQWCDTTESLIWYKQVWKWIPLLNGESF